MSVLQLHCSETNHGAVMKSLSIIALTLFASSAWAANVCWYPYYSQTNCYGYAYSYAQGTQDYCYSLHLQADQKSASDFASSTCSNGGFASTTYCPQADVAVCGSHAVIVESCSTYSTINSVVSTLLSTPPTYRYPVRQTYTQACSGSPDMYKYCSGCDSCGNFDCGSSQIYVPSGACPESHPYREYDYYGDNGPDWLPYCCTRSYCVNHEDYVAFNCSAKTCYLD